MVADIQVDMRRLVLELQLVDKKFASAVRKNIRAAVTNAGADILQAVKDAANQWDSNANNKHKSSIADATTIRPNFTVRSAGIRIVTNRNKAPHARPYEGAGGNSTFKNGKGGEIGTRPFFFPSVEKLDPETEAKFLLAMDLACREAGFR